MFARGAAILSANVIMACVTACGTSAHYSGGSALVADGSTEAPQALGATCTDGDGCTSGFCLEFPPGANAEDAGGLCSARCQANADCGGNGYCLAERATADGGPGLDGGACYRTCSAATDCSDGIPCIWQARLDAGLCQPISPKGVLCGEYVEAGLGPCETCLANAANCCDQVAACVQDVPCAKLETCAGTCASSFAASGIPTAEALGQCATAKCASACN